MIGDFFTKPLEAGALFRKFRDVILGQQHVDTLSAAPSEPEERVGKERQSTNEAAATPGTERGNTEKEECEREGGKWITVARRTKRSTSGAEAQGTPKENNGVFSRSLSRNNPVD